jgi:hypothetical protein
MTRWNNRNIAIATLSVKGYRRERINQPGYRRVALLGCTWLLLLTYAPLPETRGVFKKTTAPDEERIAFERVLRPGRASVHFEHLIIQWPIETLYITQPDLDLPPKNSARENWSSLVM